MDYLSNVEFVYEGLALVVFILISLAFIKPPAWLLRKMKAFVVYIDRWM